MLIIFLNIIGMSLILYSIYIIKKDLLGKKYNKNELQEFQKNEKNEEIEDKINDPIEEAVNDFDNIVDMKIKEKTIENNYKDFKIERDKINKNLELIIKEEPLNNKVINPLHKKIIELKSIGLTNEDIAKKLGRGIREIDIVLKIYKN